MSIHVYICVCKRAHLAYTAHLRGVFFNCKQTHHRQQCWYMCVCVCVCVRVPMWLTLHTACVCVFFNSKRHTKDISQATMSIHVCVCVCVCVSVPIWLKLHIAYVVYSFNQKQVDHKQPCLFMYVCMYVCMYVTLFIHSQADRPVTMYVCM
jgi:hypothetical protein